ncbi:MAG: hypothetical protein NTW67_01980 [Candidatus Woesearchaeota archaeon]|nr:hypothetical protein [Candidatus Woesearchaeota archaeon]
MHQAYVLHRGTRRKARGFTCQEAEEAGMTCQQFSALKLPWDSRRKTKYAENVAYLKKLEKPAEKAKKPKTAKK